MSNQNSSNSNTEILKPAFGFGRWLGKCIIYGKIETFVTKSAPTERQREGQRQREREGSVNQGETSKLSHSSKAPINDGGALVTALMPRGGRERARDRLTLVHEPCGLRGGDSSGKRKTIARFVINTN